MGFNPSRMALLRILIAACLLVLLAHPSRGQLFGTEKDSARTWKVRFELDLGLKPFHTRLRDRYTGERYSFGTQTWDWVSWDSTRSRLTDFNKIQALRLGISVNIYKGLYAGFSYQPYIIRGFQVYPGGFVERATSALVGMGGFLAYEWQMPFYERLSLAPTLALGNYQATEYFEGLGAEWFAESRLSLAWRYRDLNQLRLWLAYGGYRYVENTQSFVFPGQREALTEHRYFCAGFGIAFNLRIREEALPEEAPGRKGRRTDN